MVMPMASYAYDRIDHLFRALHNVGDQEERYGVQEHLHQELRNKCLNHDCDQIPWIKAYQCQKLISGKDFPVDEQKCDSNYKIYQAKIRNHFMGTHITCSSHA